MFILNTSIIRLSAIFKTKKKKKLFQTSGVSIKMEHGG